MFRLISSDSLISSLCLHKASLKHLILFVSSSFCLHKAGTGQFTTETSGRLTRFLLGSYSLSILASLVHLDFSLLLKPSPFTTTIPGPAPRRAPQLTVHCSEVKNCRYIFFGRSLTSWLFFLPAPIHAIHVAFPLSFVYLKTQVHPVCKIHELERPNKGQISDCKSGCTPFISYLTEHTNKTSNTRWAEITTNL